MSKYTAGPWHAADGIDVRDDAQDLIIATARGSAWLIGTGRVSRPAVANAHLIAAAPDGIELAQDLLRLWNDPEAFGDEASVTRLAGKLGPIIDKARKLVAKVAGINS